MTPTKYAGLVVEVCEIEAIHKCPGIRCAVADRDRFDVKVVNERPDAGHATLPVPHVVTERQARSS